MMRDQARPFCVSAACYPEVHVEAPSAEADLAYLVEKVAAGVDLLITQLFFDNRAYFGFVDRARAAGIRVPISAGIMPITNVAQIERFTSMCGATIPASLRARLEPVRDDPSAVAAIGIEYATAQCTELLSGGAPGIHFYTLNRSRATRTIVEQLPARFP
jgi:methylenetetrahydrofolate reductase (NADPH)